MHFDRLRLTGFKSFVEPTELEIGEGLTGIVGPNGCGKSNLLEAMRWVMGESSYKSMRASGMDDVIFAGSAGRPARNMAEVTLALDNSERTAPAAFNSEDRIEVSRRIEREAGSVYRLNGKDVRARDVQLLFADASTGARSPALVRQGQIGELISAKPQARRLVLEEAAGIAGLHARRHEADLRLNGAETNLARLDDVIGTLETQLGALKRQARQAKRYRALSGEIRSGEGVRIFLRWRETADAVAAEENTHATIRANLDELTGKVAAASRVQAEAAAALPQLREQEAKASAALQRLTLERDGLDAEARRAKARIEELTARREQIEADTARERRDNEETGQILSRLEQEKAELKAAEATHKEAVDTANAELTVTRGDLQSLEARLEDLSREATRRATERVALEKAVTTRRERLSQIEAELADITKKLTALQSDSDVATAIAARTSDVAEWSRKLSAAEQRAETTDVALASARDAEATAHAASESAARNADRIDTEIATLRKVLSVSDSELWPPMIDAVTVEPGFEAALGAALGDDLDASTDSAAPVHWRALEASLETRSLPEGATALSRHVSGPEALSRRLDQVGVVAREAGAGLQASLSPGQRLVARDGMMWRWDGYTAAAEATAAAHRLAERNRLRGLEDDAAAARDEARTASALHERAKSDLSEAEASAASARENWREINRALGTARDALAARERDSSEALSRAGALNEARSRLEHECDQANAELARDNAALSEAEGPEALDPLLAEQRERVSAARLAQAEALAKVRSLTARAEQRQQRLTDISSESESWRERSRRAETQLETLGQRADAAGREIAELSAVPDHAEEKRANLVDAIARAEDDRKSAADVLASAETRQLTADREVKAAEASLGDVRTEAARIEARLDGARQRMAELGRELGDTLDCAPEAAAGALGLDTLDKMPSVEEIEQRLLKLKAERERLGGVNLRAEEEAGELDERLTGLIAERDDLISAINKLRHGIAKLNGEGRKRLLDAFETVNTNFEALFTELFGGGKAQLALIDSDDPLEAGLEIKAQPPGKRLQVISLLSGGEKALTAIALIFAVFLTNPSPVCVLDEVDAPLDDTNVERLCSLLEEMDRTTDTRFIVITHHPYTMSRMRRLYGVTMAERGVSQLVSVDLEQAERLRDAG